MALDLTPDDPHRLSPSLFALVPCAGVGERAGVSAGVPGGKALPKQYATLAGSSLVAHTLSALAQVRRLTATLVVLSPNDDQFERHAPAFAGWASRVGGATRAQTVMNGLVDLTVRGARSGDGVLVHDAARCLVRAQWIDALIDACIDDPVGGLLALPLADTLKSERDDRVEATIDRRAKWQAQTPQMFRIGALTDALRTALADPRANITDEASAMEAAGHAPRLVVGSLENLKVTYPADFDLADRLLRTR
jgi:2-C-methyl-D-erythritol 4-phosphate cytidylyltransferase